MLGFPPIRTSSDPRSVGSSPRHNAASHVLHRLPMPRHPPCALKHLQHKKTRIKKKEIAHHNTQNTRPPTQRPAAQQFCVQDARNHYPQIKHHTPPPKQGNNKHHQPQRRRPTTPTTKARASQGLLSQSPIVCLAVLQVCCRTRPPPTTGERPSNESPDNRLIPQSTGGPARSRGAP